MQYQRFKTQACMQKIEIQLFWQWWDHIGWCSFPLQCTTSTVPWIQSTISISQMHTSHFYTPGRRRRWRRGLPNCFVGWWTLDHWRNSWQTTMYAWTFITTWTVPITVSIFRLPIFLLLWLHGFKWCLQIRRPDDHFQWWRCFCTR